MGVEYDLRCRDCKEDAGLGDSCSKNVRGMRAILEARPLMEKWAGEGIQIEMSVGYGSGVEPDFFRRHQGHALVVIGDDGVDYTQPKQ